MKFSFEAEGYRKNLADELREKRKQIKEGAKGLLAKEQETKRYQISRDIKLVSTELREYGDKNEHLEISIYDIGDKMPGDIKLLLDERRLRLIKAYQKGVRSNDPFVREVKKTSVKANIKGEYPREFPDGYTDEVLRRKLEGDSTFLYRTKDMSADEKEGYAQRLLTKYRDNLLSMFEKSAWKERISDFIDEVTEGGYKDPEMLCHFVGGDDAENSRTGGENRKARFVHLGENNLPQEKIFDIETESSDLWFNAGGRTAYFDPFKLLILCNIKNKRFQEAISSVDFYSSNTWDPEHIASVQAANKLPVAEMLERRAKWQVGFGDKWGASVGGFQLNFKKPEKWMDIADWIVDLYHGRVYKMTEASDQADQPKNE